jgi:hypothetical protein
MRIAYVYWGVPEITRSARIQAIIRELCALGPEMQACSAVPTLPRRLIAFGHRRVPQSKPW